MALEPNFDNIDDLVPANPLDNDPVDEGDDHLRGIKQALKGNVTGDATVTRLMIGNGVTIVGEASVNGQDVIGPNDTSALRFAIRNAANDANRAAFRINTGGKLFLDNKGPGQDVEILGRNAADDADLTMALFQPEGKAGLNFNGVEKFATKSEGARAFGSSLDLSNSADENTSIALFNAIGGVTLRANSGTGNSSIRQTANTGAVEDTWLTLNRSGGVVLHFASAERLASTSEGALLSRAGTPTLTFENTSEAGPAGSIFGTIASGFTVQSVTGIAMILRTNGGDLALRALAAGDTNLYANAANRLTVRSSAAANSFGDVHNAAGTNRAIGFNIMVETSGSGGKTIAEEDIGSMIRMVGSSDVLTLVNIFNGATVQVFNAASGSSNIIAEGSGITLTWLQGGSGVNGNRTLAPQSVCTLWQRTTSTWLIWGNGIS